MICPDCKGEFVDGVGTCPDCEVPLVVPMAEPVPDFREPARFEPDDRLVELFQTGRFTEADLAAAVLEDAGIPHHREEVSSAGLGFGLPESALEGAGIWWVIQVPEAVAEDARAVLEREGLTSEDPSGALDTGLSEEARVARRRLALAVLALAALFVFWALVDLLRTLLG